MQNLETIIANAIEKRIEARLSTHMSRIDDIIDNAFNKALGTAPVVAQAAPAPAPEAPAAPAPKQTRRGTRGGGRKTTEQKQRETTRPVASKLFGNGKVVVKEEAVAAVAPKARSNARVEMDTKAFEWTPKRVINGPRGGVLTLDRPVELKDYKPGEPEYVNKLRSRLDWFRKQAEMVTA